MVLTWYNIGRYYTAPGAARVHPRKGTKPHDKEGHALDIQQLIYFTTVAKTGNYSAASRQLYISQSALSKSIKKLEYELDTHLFSQVDKKQN